MFILKFGKPINMAAITTQMKLPSIVNVKRTSPTSAKHKQMLTVTTNFQQFHQKPTTTMATGEHPISTSTSIGHEHCDLTTQLYFPGQALNKDGNHLSALPAHEQNMLVAKPVPNSNDKQHYTFPVILRWKIRCYDISCFARTNSLKIFSTVKAFTCVG